MLKFSTRALLSAAWAGAMLASVTLLTVQSVAQAQPEAVTPTPRSIKLPIAMRALPTPRPTLTPTPTAPPTPPTRCRAIQPTILPSWYVYQDEGYSSSITGIGELCNPLARAIYIDYSFDAYDGQGNIVESISKDGYTLIPAGGIMCTEAVFNIKPANSVAYRFRVRGWSMPTYASSYGGTVISSSYDSASHTVTGAIRNDTGHAVYVDATVALYDASAQILQCDTFPSINDYSLDPGQITSFKSKFYDFNPALVRILQQVTQYSVMLSKSP